LGFVDSFSQTYITTSSFFLQLFVCLRVYHVGFNRQTTRIIGKTIMKSSRWQRYLSILLPVLIIIFILGCPHFLSSPRYISLLIPIVPGIVLAMGVFSVLVSRFHQCCSACFLWLGAYTVTLFMMRSHLPFWLAFSSSRNYSWPGSVVIWLRRLKIEMRLFFVPDDRFE